MKMFLGNTPIKSLHIKHYEMDTNSATVLPSDIQAGVTCFARGAKITGTGKSFEFAYYGGTKTNRANYIPNNINVVEIASLECPIQLAVTLTEMRNMDFSVGQVIGYAIVDGSQYELTIQAANNFLTVSCEKVINLEIFYGKDNYV